MSVEILSLTLSYGGLALEIVLLYLLIRGPLSRYFPLFLFILTQVIITAAEGWVFATSTDPTSSALYYNIYWGGEILLGLLQLILVISVTLRALEGNPMLPAITKFLGLILVAVLILPFIVLETRIYGARWNTGVSQILNFGAAIMNLGLWTALIANRHRDRQLLTVSAGLGLALASAAVTMGMREFTDAGSIGRDVASYAHRLLQIAAIGIWCWAFRPSMKRAPEPTAVSAK